MFIAMLGNFAQLAVLCRGVLGVAKNNIEYCCLPWIRAPSACLDRVQRKALHIIGHGAVLPSLQHRRTVAGLIFLYKLHCLPNNSPLKTLLPAQATIRPAVLHPTRLSSALSKSHPFTLSDGLPFRSRRSVRNAFPACVIPVWNSLPQFLLSLSPSTCNSSRPMFTATSSSQIGTQPLMPCSTANPQHFLTHRSFLPGVKLDYSLFCSLILPLALFNLTTEVLSIFFFPKLNLL